MSRRGYNTRINKDLILNNLTTTSVLKVPVFESLIDAMNNATIGAIILSNIDNTFYGYTGDNWFPLGSTGGSGTVTSVGLGMPSIFGVTPSLPIQTNGTFNVTLNNQTQKTVLAGPASGVPATPSFRQLAFTDISGILPINAGGTGANLSPANGGVVYSTGSNISDKYSRFFE
jgi:hypothetical protein